MKIGTPAYGRTYASAKEALDDFKRGKDFILHDITSKWNGKPFNIDNCEDGEEVELHHGAFSFSNFQIWTVDKSQKIVKKTEGEILSEAAIDEILRTRKYLEPTTDEPNFEQIEEWVFDSVCEATDGCEVEPDGICPHGHVSWLLKLGMI